MKDNNELSIGSETHKFAPGPSDWLNFWEDPLSIFTNFTNQYGDIVCLDPDAHQIYLINHPDIIKHVLQDKHHNYLNDSDATEAFKVVIGDGLAASEGELWLRQRRIMQPAFHHRNLNGMLDAIVNTTTKFVKQWQTTKESFDVLVEITELTTNISASAMFGADIKKDETKILAQALTIAQEYVYLHGWDDKEIVKTEPSSEEIQFQEAIKTIDNVVYRIINDRRQNKQNKNDLLTMLLYASDETTGNRMSKKQLRDEVVTMLAGGQSTTAIALAWIWHLLSSHPDIQARIHEELVQVLGQRLPTFQDLPHLVYTQMVIEEAMRLYPPSWLITRRSVDDDEIGGYYIPKNSQILISPYMMHRNPAFWDDPEQFDPERFSPNHVSQRPHFAYIPFSAGPRVCIGNRFALMIIEVVLAMTLQTYSLHPISNQPILPQPRILLQPEDGFLIKLHER